MWLAGAPFAPAPSVLLGAGPADAHPGPGVNAQIVAAKWVALLAMGLFAASSLLAAGDLPSGAVDGDADGL